MSRFGCDGASAGGKQSVEQSTDEEPVAGARGHRCRPGNHSDGIVTCRSTRVARQAGTYLASALFRRRCRTHDGKPARLLRGAWPRARGGSRSPVSARRPPRRVKRRCRRPAMRGEHRVVRPKSELPRVDGHRRENREEPFLKWSLAALNRTNGGVTRSRAGRYFQSSLSKSRWCDFTLKPEIFTSAPWLLAPSLSLTARC
jgi:hypothetical protein